MRYDASIPLAGSNMAPATAATQGAAPHWPPTLADVGADSLATGTVPAFVANAASIAPGTNKAAEYTIEASRTIPAAAAITVATTGSPAAGDQVILSCRALALGFELSVINGGSSNTIATIPASLTKPKGYTLWYDGANWLVASSFWLAP
jgi:hypothetical protein